MAFMNDTISVNPMYRVERRRPRKGEKQQTEPNACTPTDVQKLMEIIDAEPLKWQAYIHLLIDTGVRRGEACALQ